MSTHEKARMNSADGIGAQFEHGDELVSSAQVPERDRLISIVGGSLLAISALSARGLLRVVMAAVGGGLVYQGLSGMNPVQKMMNNTLSAEHDADPASIAEKEGIHVRKTITIDKPLEEIYAFWRNFENLPRIMNHLESVTVLSNGHTHWQAKAPVGMTVAWDAEIVTEVPNKLIRWRSLANAQVENAGSVRFKRAVGGTTELKVELDYVPPAGKLGRVVAKLFGEAPDQQIEEDLHRFKLLMEAGESTATNGQVSAHVR